MQLTFKSSEDGDYIVKFKRKEKGEEKCYIVAVELKKGEVLTFPEGTYFHSVKSIESSSAAIDTFTDC
jgi:hypothetical protein